LRAERNVLFFFADACGSAKFCRVRTISHDDLGATPSEAPSFLSVSLTVDGTLYLSDEALEDAVFDARLRAAAAAQPGLEIRLRADQAVPYGRVAALIGRLQQAGLNRIAFVAETPGPATASTPSR